MSARDLPDDEKGPRRSEYVTALVLVGLLSIAAWLLFGNSVSHVLSTISGSV